MAVGRACGRRCCRGRGARRKRGTRGGSGGVRGTNRRCRRLRGRARLGGVGAVPRNDNKARLGGTAKALPVEKRAAIDGGIDCLGAIQTLGEFGNASRSTRRATATQLPVVAEIATNPAAATTRRPCVETLVKPVRLKRPTAIRRDTDTVATVMTRPVARGATSATCNQHILPHGVINARNRAESTCGRAAKAARRRHARPTTGFACNGAGASAAVDSKQLSWSHVAHCSHESAAATQPAAIKAATASPRSNRNVGDARRDLPVCERTWLGECHSIVRRWQRDRCCDWCERRRLRCRARRTLGCRV